MNWKKNLKTCTILTGLTVASMHIVNRFVYYMSTIDEMLSDKNAEYMTGVLDAFATTKQEVDLLFS